jgi:hypothetical protein
LHVYAEYYNILIITGMGITMLFVLFLQRLFAGQLALHAATINQHDIITTQSMGEGHTLYGCIKQNDTMLSMLDLTTWTHDEKIVRLTAGLVQVTDTLEWPCCQASRVYRVLNDGGVAKRQLMQAWCVKYRGRSALLNTFISTKMRNAMESADHSTFRTLQ